MRVRAGWQVVVLGLVVVAVLAFGIAEIAGRPASGDAAGPVDAGTESERTRAPRRRALLGEDLDHAAGTDSAAARAPRPTRPSRGDAAGPAGLRTGVDGARISAAGESAAPATGESASLADDVATATPPARKAAGDRSAGTRGRSDGRAGTARPKPGTLTLVVRAAETGAPLHDADVTMLVGAARPEVVRADAAGRAVWSLDPGSTAEVRVKAPGRVVARRTGITVESEKVTEVAIDLVRGVVVAGAITRGAGVPVAGARVRAWTRAEWRSVKPLEEERFPLADVVTDRAGRYVVDAIPRSVENVVLVEAPGCATAADIVGPEPDADWLVRHDVALAPGVTLSGRVVDGGGVPVAGARVLASEIIDVANAREGVYELLTNFTDAEIVEIGILDVANWYVSGRVSVPVVLRAWRARTGADGTFEIPGCPAGQRFQLLALAEGRGRSVPSREVSSVDRPTLTLRGRTAVEFHVRTPRGEPATGVDVLREWSWETWTAARVRDGVAGTPVLDVGAHAIRMGAKGFASNVYGCIVAAGSKGPDRTAVTLYDGFAVTGVVVDDLGQRVAKAKVTGRGDRSVVCADDGSFTFDGIDSTWERAFLTAAAPGHLDGRLRVHRAEASGVTITLRREAVVTATLRLHDDAAAPTWLRPLVRVEGAASEWLARPDQLAWEDGVVRVGQLPRGNVEVAFIVPGMKVVAREVKTRTGETTDLGVIALEAARRVEGVVRDEDGNPVEGAEAEIVFDGAQSAVASRMPRRVAITGADGAYSLDLLIEDKAARVAVRAPDGSCGSADIPVSANPIVVVVRPVTVRSVRVTGSAPPRGSKVTWLSVDNVVLATYLLGESGNLEAAVPGLPVEVRIASATSSLSGSARVDLGADPSVPVIVTLR